MVYNETTMALHDFNNLKGMKLPGIQKDGHFPSKHPQWLPEKSTLTGNSIINPAWRKDQGILRDTAKLQARENIQRIQDGQSRAKPQNYGKPTLPKGQIDLFKGTKLPGIIGYPGMFMQFMDYYKQQQAPMTLPDGTPFETRRNDNKQLQTLASLRLPY